MRVNTSYNSCVQHGASMPQVDFVQVIVQTYYRGKTCKLGKPQVHLDVKFFPGQLLLQGWIEYHLLDDCVGDQLEMTLQLMLNFITISVYSGFKYN